MGDNKRESGMEKNVSCSLYEWRTALHSTSQQEKQTAPSLSHSWSDINPQMGAEMQQI